MIESKDISVVVQGPVREGTEKCLESIRQYLPGAEIILSTWVGSRIDGLDYDVLVLNDDPGAVLVEKTPGRTVYNNMNRQLLSTQSGLKKASRRYVLKFRSELILTHHAFLRYFDLFQKCGKNYNLFRRKMLTSTLWTRSDMFRKGQARIPVPFHVSDWWLFGLKEDMNTYFADTPLAREPTFTGYFNHPENENRITPYGKMKGRFSPEQYFCYMCFNRHFSDIHMEDAADINDELLEKSREAIVNNFIILPYSLSGIYLEKYPHSRDERFTGEQYITLYHFAKYESEYKRYCDPGYVVTTLDKIDADEKVAYAQLRLYKHLARLFASDEPVLQKLEQLFVGIPASSARYFAVFLKKRLFG